MDVVKSHIEKIGGVVDVFLQFVQEVLVDETGEQPGGVQGHEGVPLAAGRRSAGRRLPADRVERVLAAQPELVQPGVEHVEVLLLGLALGVDHDASPK